MIAYLNKSNASEGFEQILDFLNASVIQYALTVNPTIYVSCIKQFWSSVSIKKTNDVVRLQALIDRQKVIITEDTVRQSFHLDDAESIDCLPNEKIFAELERMAYKKPSTKLTFYKAFFSAQWKFLIHTILQCMSAKRIAWNEFSSSMAPAVICLTTGMLVPQQVIDDVANVVVDDVGHDVADDVDDVVADDKIDQAIEITKLKQRVRKLEKKRKLKVYGLKRLKKVRTTQRVESSADTEVDAEKDVAAKVQGRQEESQAHAYHIDLEHADKVLSMQDDEPKPPELKEVIKVVTTAKLMTKIVTAAATTIAAAPSAARRRKGVVIRDPEEKAIPLTIVHFEPKSKDKGKGILVEEPKPLKKKA
nr:hypothetical protein [Tanacetum cinerariifolium]